MCVCVCATVNEWLLFINHLFYLLIFVSYSQLINQITYRLHMLELYIYMFMFIICLLMNLLVIACSTV